MIQEETLLEHLKTKLVSAYEYLENIPMKYAMDYNMEIPTTALTTTTVWCGDF